jgi:hypothetical protein
MYEAIVAALLQAGPSREIGGRILSSSTTVTPVKVAWEAVHIKRKCLLSRRLEDGDPRAMAYFRWNPENLQHGFPALSLAVTVVTKAALVGDIRISAGSQETTLSTFVSPGDGALAGATAEQADATLAQMRAGAALRILYRVDEGAERVVEMDAADMDVAYAMFDSCIKAVSPEQGKGRAESPR